MSHKHVKPSDRVRSLRSGCGERCRKTEPWGASVPRSQGDEEEPQRTLGGSSRPGRTRIKMESDQKPRARSVSRERE